MKIWLPTIKAGSGADVFVKRLAAVLIAQGFDAKITWFDKRFEFTPFLLNKYPTPAGTDIIIANSWNGFAFKRPGIPLVIVELHCVFDPGFRPYKSLAQHLYHILMIKQFETASFRNAAHIVAISEYTATSLKLAFGLKEVSVIPLWVPLDKFVPDHVVNIEPDEPFRLLFVGNLLRRKGADLLAPIMEQLGGRFQLRFTTGLRSTARDICFANMTPLGHLSEAELIREYQNCHALLFPTRFEGFGYAVLEAMACGKPVIASANTSLPELVTDGDNGILCPTDDIASFVTACRTLADNRNRCAEMGKIGLHKARSKFTEVYNGSLYAAMLEAVLAESI